MNMAQITTTNGHYYWSRFVRCMRRRGYADFWIFSWESKWDWNHMTEWRYKYILRYLSE